MAKLFTKSALGILAAITAGGTMIGSAVAQTSSSANLISNPRVSVPNFDIETITPILSELGIVHTVNQTSNGMRYVSANIAGEINVKFLPSACLTAGRSDCIGLATMAHYEGGSFNPQTVSAFNQKYQFISAGVVENGKYAFVSRYDIADYGMPRGNIASSVANFYVLASKFRDEVSTSSRTVSLDGYADDLSASVLNSHALEAMGVTAAPKTNLDHHLANFEATAEIVKIFVKDPTSSKNKIVNINTK